MPTLPPTRMSGSQIKRFLILHKELDADDGELTRTRKVRRNFIADRYAVLVDALYGGKPSCYIETQVKYEDGREGKISADLRIEDVILRAAGGETGGLRRMDMMTNDMAVADAASRRRVVASAA